MRQLSRAATAALVATLLPIIGAVQSAKAAGFVAAETGAETGTTPAAPSRRQAQPVNLSVPDKGGPITYSIEKNASLKDLNRAWQQAISKAPHVTYSHKGDNWFVIAGTEGAQNYYMKSRFSAPDRTLRSFIARYPKSDKRRMDAEVKQFSRKFR